MEIAHYDPATSSPILVSVVAWVTDLPRRQRVVMADSAHVVTGKAVERSAQRDGALAGLRRALPRFRVAAKERRQHGENARNGRAVSINKNGEPEHEA